MRRRRMKLRFLGLCACLIAGTNVPAADLYRWVDKDGKVHYSQSRPKEAPTAQTTIKVPETQPADAGLDTPPQDRDKHGNCLSIKCMADQMEADRLERERGYARQRAENERAVKQHSSKSNPGASNTPNNPPNPLHDKLRSDCRKGITYGEQRVKCDDDATLQREYSKWQKQNKENYEEYERLRQRYPERFH